jgi:hypothetical protein
VIFRTYDPSNAARLLIVAAAVGPQPERAVPRGMQRWARSGMPA